MKMKKVLVLATALGLASAGLLVDCAPHTTPVSDPGPRCADGGACLCRIPQGTCACLPPDGGLCPDGGS